MELFKNDIIYLIIIKIILALLIIRVRFYISILNKVKNKIKKELPVPNKYMVIVDHIVFLFFPYIIEFLSIIYYMEFVSEDSFPIISTSSTKGFRIVVLIINSLMIIAYNFFNLIYMICCNKIFSISKGKSIKKIINLKYKAYHPVRYYMTKIPFFSLLLVQNMGLIAYVPDYINSQSTAVICRTIFSVLIFSFFFF